MDNQRKNNIHKNWLITGGCGFIGTNLVEHLVNKYNCKIRVLDNLSIGRKEDFADICDYIETDKPIDNTDKVELWIGDVRDAELAIKATLGIDCIVHLAANTGVIPSIENPRKDFETNVIGTLNYLEGARINNVKKFIFASSGAPLGEQESPIHEEKVPKPISPYGASKLAGEGYCRAYYGSYDVNTIALRFGNVYGPRSEHKNSVVAKFIKRALAGKPLEIYGDGNQTRDFIYTEDLVNAIIKASLVYCGGEIFQIATNSESTVKELGEKISSILYEMRRIKPRIQHTSLRRGEVKRNYADITKAKSMLNWSPQYTLEEGIKKTLEFFLISVYP